MGVGGGGCYLAAVLQPGAEKGTNASLLQRHVEQDGDGAGRKWAPLAATAVWTGAGVWGHKSSPRSIGDLAGESVAFAGRSPVTCDKDKVGADGTQEGGQIGRGVGNGKQEGTLVSP